jgi:dTDP-4-amino-4,6-dideoxygalactose transaminase
MSNPVAELRVVCAPTPSFFLQVRLLVTSIRANAGRFADAPIVVTVSRDVDEFDLAAAHPWSTELGVRWQWVDQGLWDRFGMYGSALERLVTPTEAPYVVLLDADTLCTGDLGDLPQLTGDGLGGVQAHVSPAAFGLVWSDGVVRSDESFWHDLYAALDLGAPVLDRRASGWGALDIDPGRLASPPYFNLGMLACSSAVLERISPCIVDELERIHEVVDTRFRCQLAVTTALARCGVPAVDLPIRWNFPDDPRFLRLHPHDANDVRVLHYLRDRAIRRDRDLESLAVLRDRVAARPHPDDPTAVALVEVVGDLLDRIEPAASASTFEYPFARPVLPPPEAWVPHLGAAYEARWFANAGPVERAFEHALRERVPDRDVAAVSSATAGMTATLLALGVHGRVAVPAFTFPATVHAILAAGCEPVFCDIDPATWELDPVAARRAIDELACVAILHVRAFGLCRSLAGIEHVARETGVPLIVDAAAAFGGRDVTGAPIGGVGDAEVVSFHATKVMGIGEGGAVFAAPDVIRRVREVSNFALRNGDVTGRATNAKLSAFAAAVGLAALDLLDDHVAVRSAAARAVIDVVGDRALIPEGIGGPPWQCVPLLLGRSIDRSEVVRRMAAAGIETRAYYCPGLHRSTAWSTTARTLGDLTATDAIAASLLCVPLYSDLVGEELAHVTSSLEHALAGAAAFELERAA